MTGNKILKPAISINLRKPLIRISKDTIHAIGDPEYFLLLVNPNDRTLCIFPSVKTDPKAHRMSKYSHRKCFELYSRSLVTNLMNLCPNWNNQGTYRMEGVQVKEQNVIKFNMEKAEKINGI